ncbi:MAG: sulfite reductase subunit A, partial [Caldilineae bacterium]
MDVVGVEDEVLLGRGAVRVGDRLVLQGKDLQALLDALAGRGYEIIGPTKRDGAIVLDVVERVGDLPAGWTDVQERGAYRLTRREDEALFGYVVGPQSWKRFLHPPEVRLWTAHRNGSGYRVEEEPDDPPKRAFFGVRPCELAAIQIQDRVFLEGPYVDPVYQARRERVFIVAVNCGQAGGTCFCASMGTGPRAEKGFDLALTELLGNGAHEFLVEVGSEAGAEVISETPWTRATPAQIRHGDEVIAAATEQMGRALETEGLKELLYATLDHPHWAEVGKRCLTCGNCTQVCPTCFCTTVEDVTDLTGQQAERRRVWDSCFTVGFSYMHGGSVRASAASRYRQWMTHKLATWVDQFGTFGCVGCGRCITWCPVGIDITEEA